MTLDKFITMFLEGQPNGHTPWVRVGSMFRTPVLPPKIDKESLGFADSLKSFIPEKLEEALAAQRQLEELREKRIKLIKEHIHPKDYYFFNELEAATFQEYFYISRWITYWLDLWDLIHGISAEPHKKGWNTEETIQRAKEYPFQDLYQGKLRKSGNRYIGLCPFHDEKHPSFFIFPENRWRCFGACAEGGDSINFAMKSLNLGFVEAVKELAYGHS